MYFSLPIMNQMLLVTLTFYYQLREELTLPFVFFSFPVSVIKRFYGISVYINYVLKLKISFQLRNFGNPILFIKICSHIKHKFIIRIAIEM